MDEAAGMPPEPPPRIVAVPYQPRAARQSERRRYWQRLGWVALYGLTGLLATLVVYVGGVMVYQSLRHRTTAAEVRGWVAALGPHAKAPAVIALLKQKQFNWEWHSGGYLTGSLDAGSDGFPFMRRIDVTISFDDRGEVASMNVQERAIGP